MARTTTPNSNRRTLTLNRTLVAALLAATGAAAPASADIWSWSAGDGFWMTPGNWFPNSAPGIDPHLDYDIRIGNLPGVQNSTVLLNRTLTAIPFTYDYIRLSSGMTLDMNGLELGSLTGSVDLTGANTRLIVREASGINFHDLNAGFVSLGPGTHLQMADGGRTRLATLTSQGLVSGTGTIHVQDAGPGASLTNSGTISGSGNGGLTFIQEGSGRFNLDGNGAESAELGQLLLAAPFSELTFIGDELADYFSGTVTLGSGSLLNMNMSNGWVADAGSTFNVSSSILGAAAQINGGHFTFAGNLNIGGAHGRLRVLADATLNEAAHVNLGTDDTLEFDADTTIEGGAYSLSSGSRIDFEGSTHISGGTFSMAGDLPSQGILNFIGATQWSGATTIKGFARQIGAATVSTPTTINANVIDMDGLNGTTWTINHGLTVNANAIESGSQQFDGTLNLNAGAIGRLTLNLNDPNAAWTMNGTLNLAGLGVLTTTRIAGSRMIVSGALTMGSGIAQITADTVFQTADVNITGNGTLRMRADTDIDAATVFSGSGLLHNGLGGSMLLRTGLSTNQVGLANDGVLRIGETGAGIVSVDRFVNGAAASLDIDLGGYLAGAEHDLLLVTGGTATLGGMLNVDLLDLGLGAFFTPAPGDEFTILSALGGVTGSFANTPSTTVGTLTYNWAVIYNPNSVVLRLDSILPAPGSLALLALGGLVAARRRRD